MQTLDPLNQPLDGLHLIEASAGTGKTYTIANLYLRLLLERGLEVDRALVVTFTEAATEELRDRIRRRLLQAQAWLEGSATERDPLLTGTLERLPDRPAAAVRVADALTRMDEAAVHTIHGFCQRMLQDNAFESGVPFEAEFITDETRLRRTVVEDFWRRETARMDAAAVAWLRGEWATPAALLAALDATLGLERARLLPELEACSPREASARERDLFARLKKEWSDCRGEIENLLSKDPALNHKSYNTRVVASAMASMDALVAATTLPDILEDPVERFTPKKLGKHTKPGHPRPDHPFFNLCGELWGLSTERRVCFLARARAYLRNELARRKAERRQLYFDDLLRLLAQALEGEGGERLAAVIRARFPVALIDEFQDTDPLQYGIFRRVYRGAPDTALFLIGDPKQAIYAFRGADVFTYIQARDDARESQRTLGTNWRSTRGLVRAVNTLFGQAHKPFVFEPAIAFHPVEARKNADDDLLTVDGETPHPLQFWFLPVTDENQAHTGRGKPTGFIRAEAARATAAAACAGRVAELLALGAAGRARIGAEPLQPRHVALLVRTHGEGDELQAALRRHGVASVTLSQASVFDSEDARELEILLQAVAEPADEGLVRAALATAALGVPASGLHRLGAEESAWEAVLERFRGYRGLWLERGFMVAFQRLLGDEGVAPRLLARPDGERRLTNLLQLGELLQVASREQPGLDGLLRWLADQRSGGGKDETRQLRLESDQSLVQIVTWHKCKGLQYPVVLIPFPWSLFADRNAKRRPVLFHDPDGRGACLDLGSDAVDAHRALQEQEALAERLRLFYVAVTRAEKHCLLCWGRVNGAERSAPAYLLYPDREAEAPASRMKALDEAALRAGLEAVAEGSAGTIGVATLPEPSSSPRWIPDAGTEGLTAARFRGRVDTRWRVSSYSGLAGGGEETERPDYDAQPAAAAAEEPEPAHAAPPDPVFLFPRGTRAGHFLHELLEQLDFPAAEGDALARAVAGHLARYGQLRVRGGGGDWGPLLVRWLGQVLDTPLDPEGTLRLRDLAREDRRDELEFHFPLAGLDPAALRACLAPFPGFAAAAEGLGFEPRAGLMRGFIDLVFRHRGRYCLADYKSNHLGDRLADYAPARLAAAMRAHRYDLQYLIYTLALHRHLARRLPDYDYEHHFGGVYYLFLRGMRPQQGDRSGVWFVRPPWALVEALDRLFAGGGEGP